MAKLRVATIRYPLALSLSIRTYCILQGLTLSEFFKRAAQVLLATKTPSHRKTLPVLPQSTDAATGSPSVNKEQGHV